ncbi:MAG: hypothetical protein M3Y59_08550 [Myxococcota bacterium]|nr:hypothetical protein [Myxococcota bacterium]
MSFVWSTDCPGPVFDAPSERVTWLAITKPDRVFLATCKVTLTVSDASAQTQCSAEVTIEDTVGPSFKSVPVNMELECGEPQQASISAWLVSVSAEDACTEVTLSHDYQGLGGGCGGQTGSALVEWRATDSCAQSASSFATVRVVDSAAPAMTCPAPKTVECAGATTAVELTASAEDACSGPPTPNWW